MGPITHEQNARDSSVRSAEESSRPRDDIGSRERPRILILAYTCVPERGSEPGMGWNRAIDAARSFDTWVLCREAFCAKPIAEYTERHGRIPGLHFVFVPESPVERFLEWIPGLMYVVYNLWHRRAFRIARRMHSERPFSLVHQLTFSGFREPGYLWKLDAPFVWGPLGGAQNYPWRFLAAAGPTVAFSEGIRSVLNIVQMWCGLRTRRSARRAALLMAASTTNQRALARAFGVAPLLFPDTGVRNLILALQTPHADGTLRILWCGVLEPRKALHLLLEALSQTAPDVAWELHVVGSGPCRSQWERLAERRGIACRVRWLGTIPHQDALAQFAWADVFAFTSLRDTSGTVFFEALAAGVPVLCLDHQGIGDVIDPTCGIKVPVTRPREVAARLARGIELLGRDRQLREELGRGARARVGPYLWDAQSERLSAMYRGVIAANESSTCRTGADGDLGEGLANHAGLPPSAGLSDSVPAHCPAAWNGAEDLSGGGMQKTAGPGNASGAWGIRDRLGRLWGRGTRAAVLALADQALVSGTRFLTAMLIGRLSGAGELGTYTLAFSLMLAALAVQDSLILGPYLVFGSRLKGEQRSAYVGNVLLEAGGLAAIALGTLAIAALGLALFSSDIALWDTIGVLAVAIPFIMLHQLGRRFAFAELDLRTAILLDLATTAIQVAGLALLAAAGALGAPAVYGLVGLACALPGIGWLLKTGRKATIGWQSIWADLHEHWRLGRWMLATQLTAVAGIYAAGWLLALRLGVYATGAYAACASIVCLTNPILLGLGNVLFPRAAIAFAEGGRAEVRRVSRKALVLLVGLTGSVALGLVMFSKPILTAAYGPDFAAYHHVIGILAVATLLHAAGMAAEQGLLVLERADMGFGAQLCGVATAFLISYALIPPFGIVGAAVGPLAGSVVTASLLLGAHEWLTHPLRAERGTP